MEVEFNFGRAFHFLGKAFCVYIPFSKCVDLTLLQ